MITYQVAHLDDASGGAALGASGGSLLAILDSGLVGVLLDTTSGSDDLGGGLAAAARSASATRTAGLALILQDLVQGLTKLSGHGEGGERELAKVVVVEMPAVLISRASYSCDSYSAERIDEMKSIRTRKYVRNWRVETKSIR